MYIQGWNTIKLSTSMKNSQLLCWKNSYRYGLRLIYLSVSPVLWHECQRVFLFCCTIAHARQSLSASAWARFLSPILKPKSRGIVLPSHLTVFYLHFKWLGSQVTLRNPKWLHLLISRHLGSLWWRYLYFVSFWFIYVTLYGMLYIRTHHDWPSQMREHL